MHALGALRRLAGVAVAGHQLGADLGVQDVEQHIVAPAAADLPVSATQRTRCVISVFGTLALTL